MCYIGDGLKEKESKLLVDSLANMAAIDDRLRCGVNRNSMEQNVLLSKSELGKARPFFAKNVGDVPKKHVFGVSKPQDPEGAREVSGLWREHQKNPDAKPGPNYVAMNKQATLSGLTKSNQQLDFRVAHPIELRTGIQTSKQQETPVTIPSDANPHFIYGRASSNRPLEETRLTGEAPDMRDLLQGSFMWDWVKMNTKREDEFHMKAAKIAPTPTRAALGHAMGGKKVIDSQKEALSKSKQWKMKKFEKVKSRV